jgi:hypothetical protein
MTKQATVTNRGASGTRCRFDVFPWGTPFQRFGAVYAVLKQRQDARGLICTGQTSDMSERFDEHHKDGCFRRHGRTHIGVHPEPNKARREAIEPDLIHGNNPPCNG